MVLLGRCPGLEDECCAFGAKYTGVCVHVAIDRFDGTIVGQQLEEVTE